MLKEDKLLKLLIKYANSRRIREGYRLVKVMEIVKAYENEGGLVGLCVKFPSRSRKGVWHYVLLGRYGIKCTCEDSAMNKKVCSHMVAALIFYYVVRAKEVGEDKSLKELDSILSRYVSSP